MGEEEYGKGHYYLAMYALGLGHNQGLYPNNLKSGHLGNARGGRPADFLLLFPIHLLFSS